MHRNLTPHKWMHRNHHLLSKYTRILPLTHNDPESYPSHMNAPKSSILHEYTEFVPLKHESTEIIIPQVNAPESYPSHMSAPKSWLLRWMHRNPTLNTWKYRNHDPSSKCTGISLTHECTEIIIYQVNVPESYPSHMNAPKSSLLRGTGILPLKHECTEIIIYQVNAPESYPSHMNAPKSSSLK